MQSEKWKQLRIKVTPKNEKLQWGTVEEIQMNSSENMENI